MSCAEVQGLLHLYTCGEVGPDEKAAIDAHLVTCPECRKALEEHEVLRQVLPSGLVGKKFFYYSLDA